MVQRSAKELAVPMLPLEVHFLVIDQSASDKQELGRLSLVSPAWTTYAQSLLFSRIALGTTGMCGAKFLALLQRNPALGRHVRRLEFITTLKPPTEARCAEYVAIMAFLDRRLSHDYCLRISSALFQMAVPSGAAAAAAFGEITRLRIAYSIFESREVFFTLLRQFTRLEALELRGLDIGSSDLEYDIGRISSTPNTAPLRLRSVSVDNDSIALVLEWLSAHAEHPLLDEIFVGNASQHVAVLNATLVAVGPRLHRLTFNYCSQALHRAAPPFPRARDEGRAGPPAYPATRVSRPGVHIASPRRAHKLLADGIREHFVGSDRRPVVWPSFSAHQADCTRFHSVGQCRAVRVSRCDSECAAEVAIGRERCWCQWRRLFAERTGWELEGPLNN
ncbi:hypothetical protein C8J57DRAFT_1373701 [Mycena rebaudengoi]|nr:hypothetical protein C8J57DRAFT_1373701 [Mycena rebaudengoi]